MAPTATTVLSLFRGRCACGRKSGSAALSAVVPVGQTPKHDCREQRSVIFSYSRQVGRALDSQSSHALASFQSRFTVSGEIRMISALSRFKPQAGSSGAYLPGSTCPASLAGVPGFCQNVWHCDRARHEVSTERGSACSGLSGANVAVGRWSAKTTPAKCCTW